MRRAAAFAIAVCVGWSGTLFAQAPGAAVNGLKLMLSAEKDVLKMTPLGDGTGAEGYAPEPTRLTLTFVNAGKARMKLIAHDLDWALVRFDVKGPDGASVAAVRPMLERIPPEPKSWDFPTLDPSRAWAAKWQPMFPGKVGPVTFRLTKPGEYRLMATYSVDETRLGVSEFAEGSWVGAVASNVLVLKYELPGAEAPRGPAAGEAEAVNGLKLTLSADRAVAKMAPRELRKADEDTPRQGAEPVAFTLSFANVSDKPIKLNAFDLLWMSIAMDVAGPGEKSVVKRAVKAERMVAAPLEKDFPAIEPGKSWECRFTAKFPCEIGASSFALQEPGEYRFRATYTAAAETESAVKKFAEGAWTGCVMSNEVFIRFAGEGEAIAPKAEGDLKVVLESDTKEIRLKAVAGPRGTVIYQPVEPAKLTISLQNTGEKPIKLYTWGVGLWFLKLNVTGPDPESARSVRVMLKTAQPPPAEADFPTLDPFSAWAVEGQATFPGLFGGTDWTILKPGEFRLSVTYTIEPAEVKRTPLAAGCWTGTLTSEEIVVKAVVAAGK